MDPGELKVTNHLRLKANYSDGQPVGPYQSYFHPRGKNLTIEELLREEGFFDENGKLSDQQFFYYPQTHAIVIHMPDKKRLEGVYPASSDGFSRAIDKARKKFRTFHPIEIQIMNQHLFLRLMREGMKSCQFGLLTFKK